jgi:hypothetical protein
MIDFCMIDWPSWIQAVSAVGLLFLTGWTLKVLRQYAADTKTIASVSASQTENSQLPFLAVIMKENAGGWNIQNQGFGPAINIRYSGDNQGNERVMRSTPPLGAGEWRELHNQISVVFNRWREFDLEYQSLSGANYATRVTLENGVMRVEFTKRGRTN